ncbi:PepSY-associated TM helix domain-containing protein [Sphingobacterium sp. SYP-B4668]|uniref:PepSY-associated TM helix domain-containing protein n=1 Tax=Sphingobacterium sp. SYP-B4668 TaxID=2996035 RepID=UPI0022DD7653|nr:PepSY-associated TM helix domain-containing protein [Sphingobacterium sp. SYP-B4668]
MLWWPKKWKGKALKRALWLDRRVKWKRFNYDLHNVLGFYSLAFALILCITGLVFAYPGFKSAYVNFFNGFSISKTELAPKQIQPTVPQATLDTRDNALVYALVQHPGADMMSLRLRNRKEEYHDIQVRLSQDKTSDFVWYYFRQEDGQIDKIVTSESIKAGDKLASMNYDIHVGSIGGIWTKVLAFVVSLICASLPVTGAVIWWNKFRKKKS